MKEHPILHLNLKKKWFDMIKSGEKKEEYRTNNDYWMRRIGNHIKIKGRYYHPSDVTICFSNGYRKDRRQMHIECGGLHVGYGKKEWGAVEGEQYFILSLGNRIQEAEAMTERRCEGELNLNWRHTMAVNDQCQPWEEKGIDRVQAVPRYPVLKEISLWQPKD